MSGNGSSDLGLEQDFNSLHAQREAAEAYVKSQAHEGWRLRRERYDDGGFSGGSMERPALQRLLAEVAGRRLDVIVVYKVDRLTRSLADFAKLVELFDAHGVSFVSVTQSFNTTTSMGRLTLNVLLSFAQFEREVTGERIRDKIAASKKKGLWMGGVVPLGYRVVSRKLLIDEAEAETVRLIFRRYLEIGSLSGLQADLRQRGIRRRSRSQALENVTGDIAFTDIKLILNFSAFTIAQIRELQPAEITALFPSAGTDSGTGNLYRTSIPADKRLLHKNTLCGADETQWLSTFVSGRHLQLAFFSGASIPKLTPEALANTTSLCGTFTYVR